MGNVILLVLVPPNSFSHCFIKETATAIQDLSRGYRSEFVGQFPASLAVGHNPIWAHVTECADCEKLGISKRFLNEQWLKSNSELNVPSACSAHPPYTAPYTDCCLVSEHSVHPSYCTYLTPCKPSGCCLKSLNSDSRLLYGINCLVFIIHAKFSLSIEI